MVTGYKVHVPKYLLHFDTLMVNVPYALDKK